MSIGFDSAKVPPVTSVNDLLKPEYKGKVALNGDPTQAGAAFSGVLMVALSQGGSADDIAPGVEFFRKLKAAGNFLPVDPTPATVESGQTPVVIDWNYLNAAETKKLPSWQVVVPPNARSPATTTRPSTRTPRIRRRRGCGRSSSTATRVRTCSPRAGSGRCAPTSMMAGRHDRQGRGGQAPGHRRPGHRPDPGPDRQGATKYLADNWAKAIG